LFFNSVDAPLARTAGSTYELASNDLYDLFDVIDALDDGLDGLLSAGSLFVKPITGLSRAGAPYSPGASVGSSNPTGRVCGVRG